MTKNKPAKDYLDIHDWLITEKIKNEKGDPIEFDNHPFLFDIYSDKAQNMVVMKAAQVGLTTCEMLKNHFDAKKYKIDIIYTLPTDGDVKVMVAGKTNRIIENNPCMLEDVADKDSVESKRVGNSMIYFRGCVDENTEVLTHNGWKKYNEIKIGELLPTLDIKTNKVTQYDKVKDLTIFETDEEMVRIKSSLIDQLVTPDHRCVISKRLYNGDKSPLRISRAYKLIDRKTAHIPTRFNTSVSKLDPFSKILGWVIGDGSFWVKRDKYKDVVYETPRVSIIQSKMCKELESDLNESQVKYYKKKHGNGFKYEINTKTGKEIHSIIGDKKKLTFDLISTMNQSQRGGLLHGLMMSDGDNYNHTTFWQTKNGSCDVLQALLVLLGSTSNKSDILNQKNRYGDKPQERVRIRKNWWTNPTITTERYKGIAWCPTTENGTIFIRRNGKVSVTGQTWTKKAAMMTPADRLVHDEKDTSKLDIINDYQARLQHSKFKQTHTFSHPSLPETGVDIDWKKSDQKHWFYKCPHCNFWQFPSWNLEDITQMSIDIENKKFVCKKCRKEIPNYIRREGQWVAKHKDRPWSGYWVPLLIAPWVSADYIVEKHLDPEVTDEFFYTKILGLPYADASSKLLRKSFLQNLTHKSYAPTSGERVVIGIDTGLRIDYVVGNDKGLFYHDDANDYADLDNLMLRWPNAIAVIDQGGDLIGSRKFYERWPGRVYLCTLTGDRSTKELVRFGKGDEQGAVTADRNRMIQLVVDEFRYKRIPVHGTEEDWFEYWLDWNNLYKLKILDPDTNVVKNYKWVRNGRDHRALATVFWRVGMRRFSGTGDIPQGPIDLSPNSYMVKPNQTAEFNPEEMFGLEINDEESDWRNN